MRFWRGVWGVLLVSTVAFAQEGEVRQPEGKSADYYRMLLKRPRPGYLFDRFFNSWLESADLASLEMFLKDGSDDEAKALLAFYYVSTHEPIKASRLYAELIEAAPDWIELLLYKAQVDMEIGAYEDGVDGLTRLLDADPDEDLRMDALKLQGRALLRLGREEDGLAAWEKLLDASDLDPEVAEELLDLQLAEGLFEKALEHCDRILAATDDAYHEVMLRLRRASILVRMDRRNDAVDCLRTAFEQTGEGSWLRRDVLSRIEQLYRGSDDLSGLNTCLDDMLEQWPDNPTLLKAYTDVLRVRGREDEALESARKLVRLMPDSRDVKDWYVDQLLEMECYDEVIQTLEGFVERTPDDNTLRKRLAEVYDLAEDDVKAREWALAFLANSEKGESDYLDAAQLLSRFGLNDDATAVYEEMLEQWPESAAGNEAIATHLSQREDVHIDQAWPHYEWLAERADVETMTRLSSVLLAAGLPEQAGKFLFLRHDDFGADYRYLTALFSAVSAVDDPDELLAIGRERVRACSTMRELEPAADALVYEIKKREAVGEWIQELSEKDDLSVQDCWLLAALYLTETDPEQAEAVLLAAQPDEPDEPDDTLLFECRLVLARRSQDWNKAEEILVELIETYPARQVLWIRRLVPVLTRTGQTDRALEWIEVWKKASPNSTRPYELERDALVAAERSDEAVAAMRRAVLKFDESRELKRALGSLLELCDSWKEAEQLYWHMLDAEEALDQRLSLLGDLIRVDRAHNRMDQLKETLAQRAERSETALFPLLGLAEIFRVERRTNERREVLERVLELRPNDVAVLREKARLEEDMGNYDAARELMIRVADEDATGAAYRKLVQFETLYGEEKKAEEMLDDPRVWQDRDEFLALMETLILNGSVRPLLGVLGERTAAETADYRGRYLYAVALEESGQLREAAREFCALLDVESERAGAVVDTDALRRQSLYRRYTGQISGGLQRMINSLTYESQAYQFRNGPSRGYSNRKVAVCPDNLETMKLYAMTHLRKVLLGLPEAERDDQVAMLETGGLAYARLLAVEASGSRDKAWWDAAAALYPDSTELRSLGLLLMVYPLADEQEVRAAVSELQDEFPSHVFRVVVQKLSQFPELSDLVPGLAARVMDDPDGMTMMAACLADRMQAASDARPLAPVLVELLAPVSARMNELAGVAESAKNQFKIARLIYENDYPGMLEVFREAFYKRASTPNFYYLNQHLTGTGSVTYYGGMGRGTLSFPPATLPTAEVNVLRRFSSVTDEHKEALLSALEQESDPLFRLMVSAKLGVSDAQQTNLVKVLEAKETQTLDELYALACWEGREAPERMLALLMEMRRECTDRALLPLIHRGIVRAIGRVEEVPPALEDELKGMVVRMAPRSLANSSEKMALLDAMAALDMPMEQVLGSMSSGTNRRSTQSNPYNRIQALMNNGDEDRGLQQVAVMIRNEARQRMYVRNGGYYQQNYSLHNCISIVKRRDAEEKLLEIMRPADEAANVRALFEYAFACDLLGRRDEAIEGYRSVQGLRPAWNGTTLQLCILLAESDLEEVGTLLNTLPRGAMSGLSNSLQQRLRDSWSSFESRLGIAQLMLFCATNGVNESVSPMMLQSAVNSGVANNRWYENGGGRAQLPALFDWTEAGILATNWTVPDPRPSELRYLDDEELVTLQQQRREVYTQLCRALAEKPPYGKKGFSQLTRYLEYSGQPMNPEELMPLAEKILMRSESEMVMFSNNTIEKGYKREPLEYYLTELHRQGRLAEAQELLEKMPEGSASRGRLKTVLNVLGAETDEQYLSAFDEALKDSQDPTLVVALLQMHSLAGRSVDVDERVWRCLSEWSRLNQQRAVADVVQSWVAIRRQRGQNAGITALLFRLLDETFTDAEQTIIDNAKESSIGSPTHQEIYQKYAQVFQVFQSLDIPGEVLPDVLERLEQYSRCMQYGNNSTWAMVGDRVNGTVTYDVLEDLGFVGDWDRFHFYRGPNSSSSSLFDYMLQQLSGSRGDALRERLSALESHTFGSGLMLTVLESGRPAEERLNRIVEYVAGFADEIAAAPEKRDQLFAWIESQEQNLNQEVGLRPDAPQAEAVLTAEYIEWRAASMKARLEHLENMTVNDAYRDTYSWLKEWGAVSRKMVESDPDTVMELMEKMCRMRIMVEAVRGNRFNDQTVLRQFFSTPQYTEVEQRLALKLVSKLDSENANQWYQQYARQMEQRNSGGSSSTVRSTTTMRPRSNPKPVSFIPHPLTLEAIPYSKKEWADMTPSHRLHEYEQIDEQLHSALVQDILKARWEKYMADGMSDPDARLRARIETVGDMLRDAGESGFVPMFNAIQLSFGATSTAQEAGAFINHLHSLDSNSLMLAQFKAAMSLRNIWRYSYSVPDRRVQDVEAYLTRTDLDAVEKVRFVSYAIRNDAVRLFRGIKNRQPIIEAFFCDKQITARYLTDCLRAFPVPKSKEEYEVYGRILDVLNEQRDSGNDATRRVCDFHTVNILLAMKSNADAALNSLWESDLKGEVFWTALEGGATDWCRDRLAEIQALPEKERLERTRMLDEEFTAAWEVRLRNEKWFFQHFGMDGKPAGDEAAKLILKTWFDADLKCLLPVDKTLNQIECSAPLREWLLALDAPSISQAHAKAVLLAHEPDWNDPASLKETERAVEAYLSRSDLGALERLRFAAALETPNRPLLMSETSQRMMVDALKAHPDWLDEFALPLLQLVPVPLAEEDEALFNACLDRLMSDIRMVADVNADAWWPQMADILPALIALERPDDVEELLELAPACTAMMKHALNSREDEWCTQNLKAWIAAHCRDDDLTPLGVGWDLHRVAALSEQIQDQDLQLLADIFFAAICDADQNRANLQSLAERYQKHPFADPVCLAMAHDLLERQQVLEADVPAPLLIEWVESDVLPALLERKEALGDASKIAVDVYVQGLLNAGQIDEVISFYEAVEKGSLNKETVQWLTDIPARNDKMLCDALLRGESVSLPSRYTAVNIQDRLKLQVLLEKISKNERVQRVLINNQVSPGIYLTAGHPEQFVDVWNVSSWRFDLLFSAYVLYSGVLDEQPDEARLRALLEAFRDGVLVYKDLSAGGHFGMYDWHKAAAFIPNTYPFSLDQEKWRALMPELLPLTFKTAADVSARLDAEPLATQE